MNGNSSGRHRFQRPRRIVSTLSHKNWITPNLRLTYGLTECLWIKRSDRFTIKEYDLPSALHWATRRRANATKLRRAIFVLRKTRTIDWCRQRILPAQLTAFIAAAVNGGRNTASPQKQCPFRPHGNRPFEQEISWLVLLLVHCFDRISSSPWALPLSISPSVSHTWDAGGSRAREIGEDLTLVLWLGLPVVKYTPSPLEPHIDPLFLNRPPSRPLPPAPSCS